MNDELGNDEGSGEDIEFEVNDWGNKPESNVLAKGRYPFEVTKLVDPQYKANSGNVCMVIEIIVDGWKKMKCYLVQHDSEGNRTRTSHIFYNFLYSIGVRNPNKKFRLTGSQIIGKKALCDIIVSPDETENMIANFSSVKEEVANLPGVPPENMPKEETEKKVEEKPTKIDEESAENL